MKRIVRSHLPVALALALTWGCDSTSSGELQEFGEVDERAIPSDRLTEREGETVERETGEGALDRDEVPCVGPAVEGTFMLGDVEILLEESVVSMSVKQGDNCLSGATFLVEDDNGYSFSATVEADSTGTLSVTAAKLQPCEGCLEFYTFNPEGSTVGLLSTPDWGEVGSCTPLDGLAMVGSILFDGVSGNSIPGNSDNSITVRIDGIQFAGSIITEAGAGTCADEVETCTDVTCGQDIYGVECGGCNEGMACIDGECQVWNCPPPGPYGAEIGQTVMNIELKDCDGNTHSLQDLCGAPVGFFNLLAGF